MPSILSKNCVLTGEVESYCLVCCKLLPAEHDVLAHIQQDKHKHNLSAHGYIDKFRRDCTRKVAGVYFCELCNQTFPTAAKVSLHVTELTHVEHKRGRMLTRGDNCIVFNENILITDNAWNGLVDDTCVLCNAEFELDSVHKSEQNHILNLIRSRVTVSSNNDIYRRVGDFYQCLTCNNIVAANAINEHLDTAQHKCSIIYCVEYQDDVTNVKNEKKDLNAGTEDKKDAEGMKNVNNKSTDDVSASGYSRSIPQYEDSLAKQHGLSVKRSDNKGHCNTCSTEIPATLHRITDHVAGRKHTETLTELSNVKKQTSPKLKKVLSDEFVTSIEGVEIDLDFVNGDITSSIYVIINHTFYLNALEFQGLRNINNKITCVFCNVDLTGQNTHDHISSVQHMDLLRKSYVITSVEDEFIRQLKPDLFHCTDCAHIDHDWEAMLEHLKTDEHKKTRHLHEMLLLDYKKNHSKHPLTLKMPNPYTPLEMFQKHFGKIL